jgi:hypothetical protein
MGIWLEMPCPCCTVLLANNLAHSQDKKFSRLTIDTTVRLEAEEMGVEVPEEVEMGVYLGDVVNLEEH